LLLSCLVRLTFGLRSNAPRLMPVRSAWLGAQSPLLLGPQSSALGPQSSVLGPQSSILDPASLHGWAHGRRFCSVLSPQSSVLRLAEGSGAFLEKGRPASANFKIAHLKIDIETKRNLI
jgi:hypothetical protein